jgi:HD-GYP domain-containing protein (c-di-GMP phosphodiesterase class II)
MTSTVRTDGADLAQLARLVEQQRLVSDFSMMLGETTDLPLLYRTIEQYISGLMNTNAFLVSSYDEAAQEIKAEFVMADGVVHDVAGFPKIPLEEDGFGIQSQVIRTGQPLLIDDFVAAMKKTKTIHGFSEDEGEPEPHPRDVAEKRITTRSAILVPMRIRGEIVGVIQVQSKTLAAYSEQDMELLSALANVAAIAIQNAELLRDTLQKSEQLKETLNGAVAAIAMTTEIRDPYTAGHQRRVADLACAIGEELGLPQDALDGLRISALLHDIGKLAIPAETLSKPARLTDIEYLMVKTHPQVAYDILQTVTFPWPIADMILQHHERLDGSGYPQGLRGEKISQEAKILAVADVVEAMSSHRPYRPAFDMDRIRAEITLGKGSTFDPEVVDACLHVLEQGKWHPGNPT